MKKLYVVLGFGVAALAFGGTHAIRSLASTSRASALAGKSLILNTRIPLPAVAGRIDHFTMDPKRRRVIFSALGNNTVEIVNAFEARAVQSIKGLDEPQGSLYVPEFDKLFVANAGNRSVNVFDGQTYALRKTIVMGEDPDNLRWDEASKRVFVGLLGAVAMIDPSTEERVGELLKTSGGHAESFQLETKGSRVFVNVPNDGGVVNVINRKTGALAKWGLNGAKANYPMAFDEDDHRLFVITRTPPRMIVLNSDNGTEVARIRVKGNSDDAYFDAPRKRIYVICGEGYISVIQRSDANHYALIENVPTVAGARTAGLSGSSLYVAVPAGATGATDPAQLWVYGISD